MADHDALLKKALVEIRSLKSKLHQLEGDRSEPIAILGVGCRLPGGGDSPEAFWQLLEEGVDGIRQVPEDRWDRQAYFDADPETDGKMYTQHGGFLPAVDEFDPGFFGISPREAAGLSPQQRLVLEVAWETLESAHQVPERLFGSPTGVFLGMCGFDYFPWTPGMPDGESQMDLYSLTGGTLSVAAGRVSYLLGLTGPSLVVDTACSSSLVAAHLACQSLRRRECDLALAGGVHLMLAPTLTIGLCRMNALAPDGRCKSFDSRADGFARGEGCGMVLLKRLSAALADGDEILAVIRGSAVNQDGSSGGLTVPSGPSQRAVIQQALADAGVEPASVQYVEAHGTGTPLGDPIEAGALEVLCEGRSSSDPLLIGSVKSNLGHLEAAAAVTGLIKVVLSLQHEAIPESLHFRDPNPHIPWDDLNIRVADRLLPWPRGTRPRIAGLSSFGLSGTNTHMILEEPPLQASFGDRVTGDLQGYLLPLSARSPEAVHTQAQSYLDLLADPGASSADALQDFCSTTALYRSQHDYRLALAASSASEMSEQLRDFLAGEESSVTYSDQRVEAEPGKLALVFSGQGAKWATVGRELQQRVPAFRETIRRCDAILQQEAGWSLVDELAREEAESRLQRPAIAQPAFCAVQIALATLWRSWGFEPQAVVGHSLGEVAAAHVAGALRLEDALSVALHRGSILEQEEGRGGMALVQLSPEDCAQVLAPYVGKVAIATINSPNTVILSGDSEALAEIAEAMDRRDVLCRALQVSFASHSPQMEPYRQQLESALSEIRPRPENLRMVSTVTGDAIDGQELSAAYWGRNIREPVQFADAVYRLLQEGVTSFIEISPHPMLSMSLAACAEHRRQRVTVVASLRRGQDDLTSMLGSVGALWVGGHPVDWSKVLPPPGRRLRLPTYPWQRRSFPVYRPTAAGGVETRAVVAQTFSHPLIARRLSSPYPEFETELSADSPAFLSDHRLGSSVLVPAAVYLEMLLAAGEVVFGDCAAVIEDLSISQALQLDENETVPLRLSLRLRSSDEYSWEIFCGRRQEDAAHDTWTLLAAGRLLAQPGRLADLESRPLETGNTDSDRQLSGEEFYEALSLRGIEFGPRFLGVQSVKRRAGEALAEVALPASLNDAADAYVVHPALLDACLHSIGALLPGAGDNPHQPIVLTGLQRFEIQRGIPTRLRVHSTLQPEPDGPEGAFAGEIVVRDGEGRPWAHVEGLKLRRIERAVLAGAQRDAGADWHYRVTWEPSDEALSGPPAAGYLTSPVALGAQVGPRIPSLAADHDIGKFAALLPSLERHAVAFIRRALVTLGWETGADAVSVDELAGRLGIEPRQRRFFQRLLDILGQEGEAEQLDGGIRLVEESEPAFTESDWDSLEAGFPECRAELAMTARCGLGLPRVLQGELDPLELLFPQDDQALIIGLYRDSPALKAVNAAVAEIVGTALSGVPAGTAVRILEVGAGTGGTTAHLLPDLPAETTVYTFSDLSNHFLAAAERRFTDFPYVRYRVLDIESDPAHQGFAGEEFDLVLASNVVHATADLRQSLEHLKGLVAPQGLLILVEGTRPRHWIDLVFGMTRGWWRFEDRDLRPHHPLVTAAQWMDLLAETGFETAESVPTVDDDSLQGQTLVLARAPAERVQSEADRWLIFADRSGVGASLAAELESSGARCFLVSAGESYRFSANGIELRPQHQPDFARLIEDLRSESERPIGVVHLWSLDAAGADDTADDTLESDAVMGCGSALHLVRALAQDAAPEAGLWLVSRGSQRLESDSEPASPIQSTLWGFGRVVALEHPELQTRLVDLSATGTTSVLAGSLIAELSSGSVEDQVAYRAGERAVARLSRVPAPGSGAIQVRGEASYLITGGMGALGLLVAHRLVEGGAKHLVLVGRRGLPVGKPPEGTDVDPDADRRLAGVRSLEAAGAAVRVVAADVGNAADMASVFERLAETEPPLAGVIHAAGVVDFRPLLEMDLSQLLASLRPKVAGTWVLHELTRDLDLDFFCLFSSSTALWGSTHLAHYAAANMFLGAIAHYRHHLGLPATTIDWGLWEQAGETESDDFRRFGLRPMSASTALDKLAALIGKTAVQEAVADVDWDVLKPVYEARGHRPLLSKVGSRGQRDLEQDSAAGQDDLEALRRAVPEDRLELLTDLVTQDVARVLGLDPERDLDEERGFFDVGMDSLTAMELKRRLEVRMARQLPDTLTFNYPTVGKLSRRLYQMLFDEADGSAAPTSAPQEATRPVAQDDDRSEEELLSLLANKVQETSGGE